MSYKDFLKSTAILLFAGLFATNVNAAGVGPGHDFVFNFTGECDDCAFSGSPSDPDFNPFNDGLTETVTATLSLSNIFLNSDGLIDFRGVADVRFAYNGSSLINPFTMFDPFTFTTALLPTGQVLDGRTFIFGSSQNAANPDVSFSFPNFCTALGEEVFGGLGGGCDGVGLVNFSLDSAGSFDVSGTLPFDVGTGGSLSPISPVPVPAAAWLFGSALLGFFGYSRRKTKQLS